MSQVPIQQVPAMQAPTHLAENVPSIPSWLPATNPTEARVSLTGTQVAALLDKIPPKAWAIIAGLVMTIITGGTVVATKATDPATKTVKVDDPKPIPDPRVEALKTQVEAMQKDVDTAKKNTQDALNLVKALQDMIGNLPKPKASLPTEPKPIVLFCGIPSRPVPGAETYTVDVVPPDPDFPILLWAADRKQSKWVSKNMSGGNIAAMFDAAWSK